MREQHDLLKFYESAIQVQRVCSEEAAALFDLVVQLRQDKAFIHLEASTSMLSLKLTAPDKTRVLVNWQDGHYSVHKDHEYHKRITAANQEIVPLLKQVLVEMRHD